jgi:hypothetical protein
MATKPRTREKAAGPENQGFQVVAKRSSFWRGGHQFGSEPRTIALAELTEAQAEQIWEEGQPGGQLVVTKVDIQPEQA